MESENRMKSFVALLLNYPPDEYDEQNVRPVGLHYGQSLESGCDLDKRRNQGVKSKCTEREKVKDHWRFRVASSSSFIFRR